MVLEIEFPSRQSTKKYDRAFFGLYKGKIDATSITNSDWRGFQKRGPAGPCQGDGPPVALAAAASMARRPDSSAASNKLSKACWRGLGIECFTGRRPPVTTYSTSRPERAHTARASVAT